MATWITHFRIAEKMMELGLDVSQKEFVVGNIGPDCGLPSENGFYPPKEITHFKVNNEISAERFYEQYLRDQAYSHEEFSFYLGYYIHLRTDEEWSILHRKKRQEPMHQDIIDTLGNPEYNNLIKLDWYGHDFVYLQNNPNHVFWSVFQYIEEFPDYLPFFEEGQILKQIHRITQFYVTNRVPDDNEFKYVSVTEMDKFVEETAILLYKQIMERLQV
ncbi:zinc dependent phospholipase C family protein [Paenibacillus sp. N1-5-1-14]|uniref:zinc dependent phospholipase C family protein n=1 Tax=Paenibacillus radicibacter TaxID=2972488 RepID=UPI00215964DD|nr:zinc dependent phospholipase C family protein [Paenibacillus radicibacter]MCR8643804.1 zinc dependent phospholipase C family protein [Paenibacillus radicibacter]